MSFLLGLIMVLYCWKETVLDRRRP